MLVSRNHKFVFIHIPKTGGSSVTAALAPYLDDPKPVPADDERGWQLDHHVNRKMHEPLRKLEFELDSDFFVFSFVRNPWTRIVSIYYSVRAKECSRGKVQLTARDFKLFLRRPDLRAHKYSQTYYLRDRSGNVRTDFVGHFDRLPTGFDVVCSEIGLPYLDLPKRNVRPEPLDARKLYDPDSVKLVRDLYLEDITRFGYEFPWPLPKEADRCS
jgi:hypothetical protein